MRRIVLALAMVMVMSFGVTACGSSKTDHHAAGTTLGTASSGDAGMGTGSASACPSDNTKAFAKTRFVADLGLIFGTFHHFIYKPYQEGAFKQSGLKKALTIGKAVAAAAVIAKLSGNAVDNVKASPTLCRLIGTPLAKANDLIQGLGDRLKHGDVSTIGVLEGAVGSVSGLMGKNGDPITEQVQGS